MTGRSNESSLTAVPKSRGSECVFWLVHYFQLNLMFIGPCNIVIVEEWKTSLMSLAISFHFLCAQHVSDINISILRSLRPCCWITTPVVLFSVRCVLEIWCGWDWVAPMLQAEAQSFASACKTNTTQNQQHQISNTQRTQNKTTDVVIQQHSRKLPMMDIVMSETCWAQKKLNKIASDIKLVFRSSTIFSCFCLWRHFAYESRIGQLLTKWRVNWKEFLKFCLNPYRTNVENRVSS